MRLAIWPVGALEANCILWEAEDEAVVVDPGAEPDRLEGLVKERGVKVKAVLLTHGHYDHAGAVAEVATVWRCPVHLHEADHALYRMQEAVIREYSGGKAWDALRPYEEEMVFGRALRVKVHHTPGHSPGSVCLELAGPGKVLLTGDTLFRGSVGRTDLPGGEDGRMRESLAFLVSRFGEYRLIPGHGPETTMEEERRSNPFLRRWA